MTPIDCAMVRRYLGEGMDITRNSERCIAIRAHIEACADCKKYVESLEHTIDCYRSYPIEIPADTDSLIDETMQLIQKKEE